MLHSMALTSRRCTEVYGGATLNCKVLAALQCRAEAEMDTEKDHIEIKRVPQHEIGLAEAAERMSRRQISLC